MKQLIAAALVGSTTTVSAQQLQALMPSPGQSMCYSRIYDRAHLANHPDQLITTMILEIKAKIPPRHREPNTLYRDFDFRIGLKMRGNNRLIVSGDNCDWSADRMTVHCSIACDMGQFDLSTARQPGSLMLTLDRLAFEGPCGENDITEVKAGKDDKIFRLDRASADVCFQMPNP